jgi:hypothetical protein
MQAKSIPRPGDVLFLNSPDVETFVSRFAQTKIDPNAVAATRTFGHVAVTITDVLAIEAVPTDPKDLIGKSPTLPHTVKIGEWTGSELRGGVRLIPIADLVIPEMRRGGHVVVLRTLDADEPKLSNFSPYHEGVQRILGSEYSIDVLKEQAGSIVPKALVDLIGPKFKWTSEPLDFATFVDVDPALRHRIEERLPSYALPEVARTYFCSQVAAKCLEFAGLIAEEITTALTTPSGLYRILIDLKWIDVTNLYLCDPYADRYLHRTPLAHSASYTSTLAMIGISIRSDAMDRALEFIKASLDAIGRRGPDYVG